LAKCSGSLETTDGRFVQLFSHSGMLCNFAEKRKQAMQDFLNQEVYYNTWRQWFWLLGVLLFVIIFKRYISRLISMLLFRMVQKTEAGEMYQEFLKMILKPLQYFIVLQTIYIGFHTLNYPFPDQPAKGHELVTKLMLGSYRFLLILNIAWLVSRIADFFVMVLKHRAEKTEDPWDDQLIVFMKDILRLLVWTIAILSILGVVFGVNIYSIIAGAGIAGIAIAFAAQESLQNIFGSISIFSEKPFIIGDLIEFDGMSGTVVKVGFRSTRIRTMDTSYVTIPNKTIMNAKLSNLSRRTSRRLYFMLALDQTTSLQKLEAIRADLTKFGEEHPLRNDEVNVGVYAITPISIEMVVEMHFEYVKWNEYVDLRNQVMQQVLRIIQQHGATLATQPQLFPAK